MELLHKLASLEIVSLYLDHVYNLGPQEIRLIIIAAAILLMIMFFRWFGLIAVLALAVVYLILYVFYINDSLTLFSRQEEMKSEHMREIQKEIDIINEENGGEGEEGAAGN